jgi:2-keto-4-pentenoate hydratase/2-oxohepta-3-ene-1,7-dioic acid hydratase in catechol pathway
MTMNLCRYDDDRLGVVIGTTVHDVTPLQNEIRIAAPYARMGDPVIAALPEWRSRLEAAAAKAPGTPLTQVKLVAPVVRPTKLVAAPVNYKKHIEEMQARTDLNFKWLPKIGEAGLFLKATSSLVGPSQGVPLRFPDRKNEFEAEIALIIGKVGSNIPREKALDHVAGYALGIDMSARGSEDRSFRKSIDGYSVLGPWMVTADEISNPDDVPFAFYVNGSLKQKSNTNDLVFDIRKLIEFASKFYTLHPGDVLYTGTPDGVGAVVPGDVMRMESGPIGEMTIAVTADESYRRPAA